MTYTKKILAQIGRHVVETHPEIVTPFVEKINSRQPQDLAKIPYLLSIYCRDLNILPESLTGPIHEHKRNEVVKVFISAMVEFYKDQQRLIKTLSKALDKKRPGISRTVIEVRFRYQKDPEFRIKVDQTLKLFL